MKIIYLLFALFFIASAGAMANTYPGPQDPSPQPFDVLQYDADILLMNHATMYMNASCTITVAWESAPIDNEHSFIFHLEGLTVDSVLYADMQTTCQAHGGDNSAFSHFTVEPTVNDDTVKIIVYYHGRMTAEDDQNGSAWGGVHYGSKILYAMGVGFHNPYFSTTRHWLACYDHPADKAKFKCRFNVADSIIVASNGVEEMEDSGNGRRIYTYTHDYECATYLLTFAMAKYMRYEYDYNGLPIIYYTLPGDSIASHIAYSRVDDMIAAYEELFGPYPFESCGYVNTPIGSMEHETMISMSTYIIRVAGQNKDSLNSTVGHELAHQWFGDCLSPMDFRETWLNEAFATYCESLLEESIRGPNEYKAMQRSDKSTYLDYWVKKDGILSLYAYDNTYPSSNYPGTIYYKGSIVLGMLRDYLGDSLFFESIRKYIEDHKYGNVTTPDLIEAFESTTGQDLGWYFDQWVYGSGWPSIDLSYRIETIDSRYHTTLTLHQTQVDKYGFFNHLPVEIKLMFTDGSIETKTVVQTEQDQQFAFDFDHRIRNVKICDDDSICVLATQSYIYGVDRGMAVSTELGLFPTPADDYLTIECDKLCGNYDIEIMSMAGQQMLSQSNVDINKTKSIKLSNLPAGVYYILVRGMGRQMTNRFTIVR